MRCSFTGEQVDWTMKISLPRILSLMSTDVSPSENRFTSPWPSSIPRIPQMLSASPRLEFPVRTQILDCIDLPLLEKEYACTGGFKPPLRDLYIPRLYARNGIPSSRIRAATKQRADSRIRRLSRFHEFGWDGRIRTSITRSKISCPALRRHPS